MVIDDYGELELMIAEKEKEMKGAESMNWWLRVFWELFACCDSVRTKRKKG